MKNLQKTFNKNTQNINKKTIQRINLVLLNRE
jgi:hypothetical protein